MPSEIERLYREHRAGLVRLVERELHDRNDAEDVVQTAFLDAQRALERGAIPRNPRAWLAAIALNAGRRLRRRRLNAEPLEDYAVHEASGIAEISAALESLPREQRTAVVYRDVLGLSYGETAKQMGTSVDAVTMLLHRGRRRLRQTLGATTVGLGLWRWGKRLGVPQVAVAKGTATVVVAAGLATTGIVTARAVAPVGTHEAAAVAAQAARAPGNVPAPGDGPGHDAARQDSARHHRRARARFRAPAPGDGPGHDAARQDFARHHRRAADGSNRPSAHATTGVTAAGATSAPLLSSTADTATAASRTTAQAPPVQLPSLPVPTTPTTVAVTTPVATVTATVPTVTTLTVTTPITTVTLPIP